METGTETSTETSTEPSTETVAEKATCEEWEYRLTRTIAKHLINDVNEFIRIVEHSIPWIREFVKTLEESSKDKFKPHRIAINAMLLGSELHDIVELGRRIYEDANRLFHYSDCMAIRDCYID